MPIHKKYGWSPDLPDHRDHMYAAPSEVLAKLPPKTDLRPGCPPVYDQGTLSSCTANAIAAAMEFDQKKQGIARFVPSRLFIYYNERVMEGTVASDAGAQVRDGIKSIGIQGACPEQQWPYSESKVLDNPTALCYRDARKCEALAYKRLIHTHLNQLKGCLASGYPFIFGFTVYNGFEDKAISKTGKLDMPRSNEKTVGGHAVLAVGYDDSISRFIVRNSWGKDWGIKGYFTMPYAYVTSPGLADSFWTVRGIS